MKTYKQARFWFIYDVVFVLWCIGWFVRGIATQNYASAVVQAVFGALFTWWAVRDYKRMNKAKLEEAERERQLDEWLKEYNDGRK